MRHPVAPRRQHHICCPDESPDDLLTHVHAPCPNAGLHPEYKTAFQYVWAASPQLVETLSAGVVQVTLKHAGESSGATKGSATASMELPLATLLRPVTNGRSQNTAALRLERLGVAGSD